MNRLVALVAVAVGACATTSVICPAGARLADEERPTGRVEWCATTLAGPTALPVEGRTLEGELGVTPPPPVHGGLDGPYTHWYPDGTVESHGEYVAEGVRSVPTGIWTFWYPSGARRTVGRYDHGRPSGCFAIWDEQGSEVTGMVEGDHLREQTCEPPIDPTLAQIEARSHPRDTRPLWGDISFHTLAQAGTFGASNSTQTQPEPAAMATAQIELRKYLGRFRAGSVFGLRLSDSEDAKAYTLGAVAAYGLPLLGERFEAEVQLHLDIQYLAVTAQRPDRIPTTNIGLWTPLAGVRLAGSFAINSTLLVVGGVSVDGWPSYASDQSVEYFIGVPTMETWTLGGFAYGVDVGVRLRMR